MIEPASTSASGSAIVATRVENGRTSYGNQACAHDASRRQTKPLTFFSKAPLVSYIDSSALPLDLPMKDPQNCLIDTT